MQWIFLFFGAVLLVLGIVFTGISATIGHIRERKQRDCTVHVYANVADIQKKRVGGRRIGDMPVTSWFPVYEYMADGVKYRRISAVGTSKPELEVGQSVDLYYNPADPDDFYVRGSTADRIAGIFKVTGILLLAASSMFFILFFCGTRLFSHFIV